MLPLMRVKANSTEPITFSSGLTLYSPVNTTYSSNIIECNGTFNCPKGVQSSLNYSLDGKNLEGLPWKLDPNSISIPDIYTIDGSFDLPQLPDGSHQLSIGILEELFNNSNINSPRLINSSSWVNTVYFTIYSNQSTNPTSAPTPTVPEFSSLMILPLFAFVLACVVLVSFRNRINKNTK
jgi:hypothetical protein